MTVADAAQSPSPSPASPDRLIRLRRLLARSRGGKVQFIVAPQVQFDARLSQELAKVDDVSAFDAKQNRIRLDPAANDSLLLRDLARRCFQANVHRYKTRFRTLALIERVPGVRGLWSRIIDTMTDAVMDDLRALGVAEAQDVERFRANLDRDVTASQTIIEILEVVNHGIDGYVRREMERDPAFRQRVVAVMGESDPVFGA